MPGKDLSAREIGRLAEAIEVSVLCKSSLEDICSRDPVLPDWRFVKDNASLIEDITDDIKAQKVTPRQIRRAAELCEFLNETQGDMWDRVYDSLIIYDPFLGAEARSINAISAVEEYICQTRVLGRQQ